MLLWKLRYDRTPGIHLPPDRADSSIRAGALRRAAQRLRCGSGLPEAVDGCTRAVQGCAGLGRAATPSDGIAKGAWWEVYKDPQLNALVERLNTSNQTVAQYDAQYRQAQTLVRSSR
ncbi:RND efflux system, outer membrane lipoprotein, NodT, partial [Pseudomonas syringae pv. pisi str. 1704B]